MALTDTDLRDVLADRASAMPADISLARVAAVDRRVRVIRRRRAAGASLAVVILLLVVTGVSGLFRDPHDRTAPVPAHLQKVAGDLLPRYNGGGQATAYTSFSTDVKRESTFTFTPTSRNFLVSFRCDKDMPQSQSVTVTVDGKPFMAGGCNAGITTSGPTFGAEQARADDLGLRLGVPVKVLVHVAQIVKGSKVTPEDLPVYRGPMAVYRIGVAAYSPMSVADYPFPPRPRTLESLDAGPNSENRLLGKVDSRSVGADGHGVVQTTLTSKGVQFELYAVAPGAVTMTVDNQPVDVARFWTWQGSGYGGLVLTPDALRRLGVDVKAGDRITVGFAGSRFTDPGWRAEVREGS